jgi:hypothetical protein
MEWKELFYDIFRTLNPDSYDELVGQEFKHAFRYFTFILLLSVLFMFILSVPAFLSFPSYLQDRTSGLESLYLNKGFTTDSPVKIFDDPDIYLSNDANVSDGEIVITHDAIYAPEYYFFGKMKPRPLDMQLDLKNAETIRSKIYPALLFIIPSLFFWSIIFYTIYFWIIILGTFIIASILKWAFRSDISWRATLKTCIYSSTILISLHLVLLPFFRMFFIPLVAYWILVLLVLFLLREEKRTGRSRGSDDYGIHHQKSKVGTEKRDSYDVDERGNLRGKRKRSYEEENDGYVELK